MTSGVSAGRRMRHAAASEPAAAMILQFRTDKGHYELRDGTPQPDSEHA